jgi:hypothetical protein
MGKKYWMIGNTYEAEGPVDFWRKWNPHMHQSLNKLYEKLGGIERPLLAAYTPFVVSGVWHDLLWEGVQRVSGNELFDDGFWTLSFAVFGLPVVADKYIIKHKAKKCLGKELDSLVEQYGANNPQEVLTNFSSNLTEDRVGELSDYFSDYQGNRGKLVGELFKDTKRGLLSVMRERKEKRENSKIPKPVKTVLTWGYVLGTLGVCDYLLK